jgi:hypothetical protein
MGSYELDKVVYNSWNCYTVLFTVEQIIFTQNSKLEPTVERRKPATNTNCASRPGRSNFGCLQSRTEIDRLQNSELRPYIIIGKAIFQSHTTF